MVSKKVTKRKTVWRSLPIAVEVASENGAKSATPPQQYKSSSYPLNGTPANHHQPDEGCEVAGNDVLRPVTGSCADDTEANGTTGGSQEGVTVRKYSSGLVSSSTAPTSSSSYHQGHQQQRSATQYDGKCGGYRKDKKCMR